MLDGDVVVLRLGHRPGRDDRMTTHVGLTARAFGADRVLLPSNASDAAGTVRDVTDRFGGPFAVEITDNWRSELRDWPGGIAHLTMYGSPLRAATTAIRDADPAGLLVVVGAGKVPGDAYEHADWNVRVTNQPHSEVAALAVFLDHLHQGEELDREWVDADRHVEPRPDGDADA